MDLWDRWPLERLGLHALDPNDPRIAGVDKEVRLHQYQVQIKIQN